MSSRRPEKTLPPDLTGTARIKLHKGWVGNAAGESSRHSTVQRQGGLEMWRGRTLLTPFFWRDALMWELSSGSVSGVVWPFLLQCYNQDCVAFVFELYGSFINCVGSLLPLLLHFGEMKFFQMSWDHFLARLLQQRNIPLLGPMHNSRHPMFLKIDGGISILDCVYYEQNMMIIFWWKNENMHNMDR